MSKRRLLLADDSVTIQKVVNLTFAEEGIEVITAGDGNTAMEKFVQSPPDLVMVDVNMPGFDGYKICEMIKQDEETRQIPVILLVGSFEPFDEAEARRVGADDYLTKPFQSIRQLVSKVSELLNRSNSDVRSSNQDNVSPGHQTTEASIGDFGSVSQMTNAANFELFEDAGMDDEMIQTDQIGSLPADETQKFVSEPNLEILPNLQTSENNFVNQYANEKEEEVSLETQPLSGEYFQRMPVNSTEDEILGLDEKIFEFDDEQPVAQENESNVSEHKSRETSDDKKFPEYSATTDENKNTVSEMNFNETPQQKDNSIFDFDDLDLLDLSPAEKKPLPVAGQKDAIEAVPQTSDAKSIDEKQEPGEIGEKEASEQMANLSPEVIEAITKKIMEKLSDKVIREIVQEITPQTVESVVREMAQKKTN